MQKAVNILWPYTGELFEMDEVDTALLRRSEFGSTSPAAPALA